MKKILLISLLIIIIAGVCIAFIYTGGSKIKENNGKLNVVVTNFSTYDFVRQIAKDNVNLTFLLDPGVEAHGYEPTAADLIEIQNADIFIYIGGEMETWADKTLESLDTSKIKLVCISDYVETMKEQEIDGAESEEEEEEEGAFDAHIWTSPKNAIKMMETLTDVLIEKDEKHKEEYQKNSEEYIAQINEVDREIQEIVDNRVFDRLVFGDKMPMQYFISYYGLQVTAAFNGCSTETEPSSATIAYLINKIKEENLPAVLYIELNTGKVAQTIAEEVGGDCKALQIQTLHNISKEDFENGETWVSLMKRNLDVLKFALQ